MKKMATRKIRSHARAERGRRPTNRRRSVYLGPSTFCAKVATLEGGYMKKDGDARES